jgi:hypothetical protein
MIDPAKMAAFTGGARKDKGNPQMQGKGKGGKPGKPGKGNRFGKGGQNAKGGKGNPQQQQQQQQKGKGKKGKDKQESPVDFNSYENGKYSDLAPLLEESAPAIEASANDSGLDASVLHGQDAEGDAIDIIKDDYNALPEELQDAMQSLSDASLEDIRTLGTYLAGTGMIDDGDLVTSWLFVAAKEIVGNTDLSSNEEEKEEEPAEEEEEFTEEELGE